MKYDFDQIIDRTGTFCTQWDYVADRFGASNLLPFTISDMDFPAPPSILDILTKRIRHGIFGYTRWNHQEFKGSIRQWFARRFSSEIKEEWIVYSPSVIYSCAALLELVTEKYDHVVVQTPAYDAFYPLITESRRKWVPNELLYDGQRYRIDFHDLEEKLSHPKAKALLLCSPHNPTGRVWTEQELQEILRICEKYQVFVISDEIHMDIVYDSHRHIPITEVAETCLNRVFICTSASKTFNISGLGGSYAIIPNDEIRQEFLKNLKKNGLSNANIFGMLATIEGYQHAGDWVDELVAYLRGNLEVTQAYLERHLPDLRFHLPEATYLAWIDCSNLPFTSDQLQDALVHHAKVAIMPGEKYGSNTHIRMNIGCPRTKVIEGLNRLKKAVDYLRDRHPS